MGFGSKQNGATMSQHYADYTQPLLTPQQTARLLSISPRKLWSLTHEGRLPHLRIGRCIRYSREDLQRWLANERRGGEPQ